MAARPGFKPMGLRTKGSKSTNEPQCPTACCDDEINEQRILRVPAIALPGNRTVSYARCRHLQGEGEVSHMPTRGRKTGIFLGCPLRMTSTACKTQNSDTLAH